VGPYSSILIGNKLDDPSSPLTAAQIAKLVWGRADDASRKKAREWMKAGKLPANRADGLKDHYVVSKSALDLLIQAERQSSDG